MFKSRQICANILKKNDTLQLSSTDTVGTLASTNPVSQNVIGHRSMLENNGKSTP